MRAAGGVIAGRYELIAKLGKGGHGEVWEARDLLADRRVAVKLLQPDLDFSPARVQLETAALRQRLPGVVELYDDGVEDGAPYLVMERVDGLPFPGRARPCPWADLAEVVTALLEALAHVHAAFVIHRDLKPENVLVTRERGIKLLDFGLAYRVDAMAERLTQRVEILGTPAYMAPEQVQGKASEQSDLYAVGVMIYEALSGRRPHEGKTFHQLLAAKKRAPVPLAQAAPGVPAAVARLVEDLLAPEIDRRPRSAIEVLSRLRGEASVADPHFPWLGPQDHLHALVSAVRAGRSADLVGPRGSGRTRCLRALAQVLGDERRVVVLLPGESAFESLIPVVGTLAEHGHRSLAAVRSIATAAAREALAGGAVLVADDAERIDPESLAVLGACRDAGPVVRVFSSSTPRPPDPEGATGEEILVPLLGEVHLRSLFAGPDRLLHLREDAARVLHHRTQGLPRRVTEEITAWVRLGVAHWTRNLVVVQRTALEALESGLLHGAPLGAELAGAPGLSGALLDLLAWLTLAWPQVDPTFLAQVSGEPRFHVEKHLEDLERAGYVERGPDGRVELRVRHPAALSWTEERVRAAHAALARHLAAGTPGRLAHLWLRGARTDEERREIAQEAAALAGRQIEEGRLDAAMVTAESGLRAVRHLAGLTEPEVARLLSLWVEGAIVSRSSHAIDRVLYEICRAARRTPLIEQLERLCRAALAMQAFTVEALARAAEVEPFGDIRLERVRIDVYAEAARHLPDPAQEEEILGALAAALPVGDADAQAMLDNYRGRLRYRQGRFLESAELHRRAAQRATNPLLRTYSNVSGAFASMDGFACEDARAQAMRARETARTLRHVYYETLAEWVLRTVAYRLDEAGGPDLELVEAAAFVGVKQLEGVILLNEAAVAWRGGDAGKAAQLAGSAHGILSGLVEHQSGPLARCLAILAGAEASAEDVQALWAHAGTPLLPGIGIQVLALLRLAGLLPPGRFSAEALDALCQEVPPAHWGERMDILSVDECRAALLPPAPVTGSSAAGTAR
jgi:hypothetical protein